MEIPTVALLRVAYNEIATEIGTAVRQVAPDQRPAHGAIMEQLDFTDGMRLTDLAKGAGLTPQSAGELVDQLEELGYVERRPHPDDRRAKRIYRTAKAKRASQAAVDAARQSEEKIQSLLGERRYTQMRNDLAEIIEAQGGAVGPPIQSPSATHT
jgi:DNA-binding MarR family transcriptional regulator